MIRRQSWHNVFILFLFGIIYLFIVLSFWFDDVNHIKNVLRERVLQQSRLMYSTTDTLILIPGHGVLNALNASDWQDEEKWGLEPYQLREGVVLPFCFASHIRRGVEIMKKNLNSTLLIFSGGQTRVGTGPRSEGLSYYVVAEETHLFGLFDTNTEIAPILNTRVFAEEFARDSYENLIFSVARFYEITGRFPEKIIVVGWKHKERRFIEYHRAAIRFPLDKFIYVGLDFEDASPFVSDLEPYRKALPYNDDTAIACVSADLYLCHAGKKTREERNPLFRTPPYGVSCPPMRHLLSYCGPEIIDKNLLPWK